MARCEECLHFDVCQALEQGNGIMKVHPIYCGYYKNAADVAPKSEGEFWEHQCFHARMNNGCLNVIKIKENLSYGHPDPVGEPGDEGEPGMLDCTYWRMRYAEVAREIFWEVDKLLTRIITDDEDGTQFIGVDMQKYYALKKKYTEK